MSEVKYFAVEPLAPNTTDREKQYYANAWKEAVAIAKLIKKNPTREGIEVHYKLIAKPLNYLRQHGP